MLAKFVGHAFCVVVLIEGSHCGFEEFCWGDAFRHRHYSHSIIGFDYVVTKTCIVYNINVLL